ncbi:MBOAT family protein [Myxococcota bacterium]|nr:MBOAT family protein [Myxococcota bacterium]
MLFLDLWFWGFAGIAIPGFWLCPRRLKLIWLVAASAVFHWYFAGPAGVLPILALAIMTYSVALAHHDGSRRTLLTGALVVLVGALSFYKYSEFALHDLGQLLASMGETAAAGSLYAWQSPAAPLAISFFTFEFFHYLYEVRYAGREPIRNPLHFALFAIFFPTLASGPIKRFNDFVPQLANLRNPSLDNVVAGAGRVIRGLFKKVCIADLLIEPIAIVEQAPNFNLPLLALLGVLQGFRIYYDFCGYTDMAVGLARMLGLRVPENFDRPYLATSLQNFWRRWHMSLTSWIRDYIYIPLGGNRKRRTFNLLAAMALCGLWHGAAWNFALWGVFHGLGLGLEAAIRNRRPEWFEPGGVRSAIRWLCCYAFVCYGWLLFFYPLKEVARMTSQALASPFGG